MIQWVVIRDLSRNLYNHIRSSIFLYFRLFLFFFALAMGQENDLVLNTRSMEQTREYTKKMGRWRRRAIEVTGNIIF